MKPLLRVLFLMSVSGIIGFAVGRSTAEKPDPRAIHAVAVDCYDSSGKLVEDMWGKQFGAVRLECAPGQTAKLHQPPPK